MRPISASAGDRARAIGALLSFLGPLCVYLGTASGHGYFLDSGEFVAASIDLGIAHPPGHPLHSLLGRALCMIPLGPLAFRVAVVSALCAAIATAALYLAILRTLRCSELDDPRSAVPLALGASWSVAFCYGFFVQALKPEVYALQGALTCIALERLTAFEQARLTGDASVGRGALVGAALALGLGLANHHFLSLLMVPAMLPAVVASLRAGRLRGVVWAAAAGALGLLVYSYLPLRAPAEPHPNLGAPMDLSRLYWVVSAKTFQGNLGRFSPEPYPQRLIDLALLLVQSLHVLCLLVPAGLYALLRPRPTRRLGTMWLLVLVLPLLARAWAGFIANNPDAAGYILPSFAAIGALAAVFVGQCAVLASRGGRPSLAVALGAVLLGLGLGQLPLQVPRTSLASFVQTDVFDAASRRALPSRAVVIAYDPGSVFRLWGMQSEDLARPDIGIVPVPLLHYPGMRHSLGLRDRDLAQVVRERPSHGIDHAALLSLSRRRPVLLEANTRVPRTLYDHLHAAGLYLRLETTPQPPQAASMLAAHRELYKRLGPGQAEQATRELLLWRHFAEALFFMATGDRQAARSCLLRARKIEPRAQPLPAMQDALDRPQESQKRGDNKAKIDIVPFIEALRGGSRDTQG